MLETFDDGSYLADTLAELPHVSTHITPVNLALPSQRAALHRLYAAEFAERGAPFDLTEHELVQELRDGEAYLWLAAPWTLTPVGDRLSLAPAGYAGFLAAFPGKLQAVYVDEQDTVLTAEGYRRPKKRRVIPVLWVNRVWMREDHRDNHLELALLHHVRAFCRTGAAETVLYDGPDTPTMRDVLAELTGRTWQEGREYQYTHAPKPKKSSVNV